MKTYLQVHCLLELNQTAVRDGIGTNTDDILDDY